MKVLVLGSKGQLGCCLYNQFDSTLHEVIYTSREEIDITNFAATKEKISEINPKVVINASAYTAVDNAEEDKHTADLINHLAVANIANICTDLGCWLIHVSTDYVFDGSASRPYKEYDITNPQSVYGATKLNGEYSIQSSKCKYIIVRTAWVFSEYGNNFMKTMLGLGADSDNLRIVGDQFGCPTYAQDIAKAIVCMLNYMTDEDIVGIYHFSGYEKCSWFEFGVEIFRQAKELGHSIPNNVQPVSTLEYPTLATRPIYSALDSHKILEVFGVSPSDWRAGILNVLVNLQVVGQPKVIK